jgi:hypothetical protein
MNIGISAKIALTQIEENQIWLSLRLGTSLTQANRICNSKCASSKTIERLSSIFNMTCSNFISLGEGLNNGN